MNRLNRVAAILLIMGFCSAVFAQVFKWTDEQGVTHYGDQIPAQYRTEAETVEIKINVVETVVPKHPDTSDSLSRSSSKSSSKPLTNPKQEPANARDVDEPTDLCQQQWQRFDRAQACREACASDTSTFSGAGLGRKLKCGCPKVEKPRCRLD